MCMHLIGRDQNIPVWMILYIPSKDLLVEHAHLQEWNSPHPDTHASQEACIALVTLFIGAQVLS